MNHRVSDLKRPDKKTLIRMRRWVWVFLILSIVSSIAYGLSGLRTLYSPDAPYEIAQKKSRDPMKVTYHARVNGISLYIPFPYFSSGPSPDQRDEGVIVLYPEFLPLTKRPQKLWEEGEWYRNVRILFGDPTGRKTPPEIYESQARSIDATEFKGMMYGLHYYSQPEGIKNDGGELWVDNPEKVSTVIKCGKILSAISKPQCSLYVMNAGLWYTISYDKELLPHWKEIRDKSLNLVESFRVNPSLMKQPEGE